MEAKRCPVCNTSRVLAGSIKGGESSLTFVPTGIPGSLFETGVPLIWHVCLACGYAWGSVTPQALRHFVEVRGGELLKQHIERLDKGVGHDLPDFLKSHQADEHVAEIDELVLAGKRAEATRRYRELSRATWDQAIETMQGWRNLKRDQKLALFGWPPEEKRPVPTSVSDHPMVDPWIDRVLPRHDSGPEPVDP
jgi:hypothetical protein